MALIDITCTHCQAHAEVYRPAVDWPRTPPCAVCGGPTVQVHLPPSARAQPDPVVVFRAPDGSFRFPGNATGLSAKNYEQQGFTRVELRGWADVRRFEGQVNAEEKRKIERRIERQEAAFAVGRSMRRSDFHHGLHHGFQVPVDVDGQRVMRTVHLSQRARDIAHIVMDRNNRSVPRSYDPQFRVECYSESRSNRETARDPQGRRYRD